MYSCINHLKGGLVNVAVRTRVYKHVEMTLVIDSWLYCCPQDCVSAVCRWMSAYGWPDGTRCISTPSDFRLKVGNGESVTYVY